MSRGSHVPTSRVTACNRGAVGACPEHRSIRCWFSAGTVQAHPGQHAVVVRGITAASRIAQSPSSRRPCHGQMRVAAVDPAGGELGAQVWACAGPDVQRAVLSAPGDQLDPRDGGADRFCADAVAGGERVPVAARSALRASHGGVDDRRCGLTVGGPLSRPSVGEATWNGAVLVNRALRSASMVMSEAAFRGWRAGAGPPSGR